MKNLYQNWTIGGSGYAVLQDKQIVGMRTFKDAVKDEKGKYKTLLLSKKDIPRLTYNAVDLGLPSGTLWADRNVGATSPENFGVYFAWGETDGYVIEEKNMTNGEMYTLLQSMFGDKIEVTPDNIDETLAKLFNCTLEDLVAVDYDLSNFRALPLEKCFSPDWSDYFDTTDGGDTFIKYNDNSNFTVLQPEDDAATVNMGSGWKIPTYDEMSELIINTTQIFIDFDGNEIDGNGYTRRVKGVKFIGINGNSIFIPNAGYGIASSITGDALLPYSNYTSGNGGRYCRGMRIVYSQLGVSCGGMTEEEQRFTGLTVRAVKNIN